MEPRTRGSTRWCFERARLSCSEIPDVFQFGLAEVDALHGQPVWVELRDVGVVGTDEQLLFAAALLQEGGVLRRECRVLLQPLLDLAGFLGVPGSLEASELGEQTILACLFLESGLVLDARRLGLLLERDVAVGRSERLELAGQQDRLVGDDPPTQFCRQFGLALGERPVLVVVLLLEFGLLLLELDSQLGALTPDVEVLA